MEIQAELPLHGITVATTQAQASEARLHRLLSTSGAQVLSWPTLRFHGPSDPVETLEVLSQIEVYDWVVFTIRRAAQQVTKDHPRAPGHPRVAAVGGGDS